MRISIAVCVCAVLQDYPYCLLWLARRAPHTDCHMGRKVGSGLLNGENSSLHVLAVKLKLHYLSGVLACVNTGKCNGPLFLLVCQWAIFIPSNTQSIEAYLMSRAPEQWKPKIGHRRRNFSTSRGGNEERRLSVGTVGLKNKRFPGIAWAPENLRAHTALQSLNACQLFLQSARTKRLSTFLCWWASERKNCQHVEAIVHALPTNGF